MLHSAASSKPGIKATDLLADLLAERRSQMTSSASLSTPTIERFDLKTHHRDLIAAINDVRLERISPAPVRFDLRGLPNLKDSLEAKSLHSTTAPRIGAFEPSAKPRLPPSGGVPGAPTAGSLASRRSLIMPWILGGLAIAAAAGTGAHLWLLPGSLLPRALAGVACGLLGTGFATAQFVMDINSGVGLARNHSILYWAAMYAVEGIGLAAFAPTLMAAAIGTALFNRVAVGVGLGLLPTAVAELMPARGLAAARIVVKQANRVQAYLPRLTCAVLVGASFLLPTYPVVGHIAATALHTRQVTRLMASTLMTSRRCNGDEARRAASLAPQILLNTALPLCWTFGAVQARLH